MFTKKHILILLLLLTLMCAISHVSADEVNSTLTTVDNDEMALEQTNDDITNNTKTFFDLNKTINDNTDSEIYLDCNYDFNSSTDSDFTRGIEITRGVTIYGNGHTIDAKKGARIFLASNASIVFRDLIFTNGYVKYNEGPINGGAINGQFTCINCTFTKNYATNAGAIDGGTVINCTFEDNYASYWGGAIYRGFIYNCTFIDNAADYGGALWYCYACENSIFINNFASLYGGAIHTAPVINCTFIDNYGAYGGALYVADSYDIEECVNSTFVNNTAKYGGAICHTIYDDKNSPSKFKAINCNFTGNKATSGGASYNVNSIRSTFNNNSASKNGGAMHNGYCLDSTFYANHAENEGGAVYNVVAFDSIFESNTAEKGGAMSKIEASNCTFANNHATVCGGAIFDAKFTHDITFDNNTSPLGNDTYNATASIKSSPFSDLNMLINGNNLRQIELNENYAINLGSDMDLIGGITIDRPVTINGNNHIIDGRYLSRAFNVLNKKVTFKDIIFLNGYSSEDGGAIKGTCTIINCTFIGNMAVYGGAAYGYGNSIINSIFIANTAEKYGGAMFYGDAVNCTFINNTAKIDGGALDLGSASNCTFINNTAEKCGGALYHSHASDCRFISNSAENGGSIYSYSTTFNDTAIDCEFIANTATNGGATYNIHAVNCKFTNNTASYGGAMYDGVAYYCIFKNNTATEDYNDTYRTPAYNASLIVSDFTTTYNSKDKLQVTLKSGSIKIKGEKVQIKVYRANNLIGIYHCLSGDKWIVGLDCGKYIAVLSIEGRDVDSVNVTLTVKKATPKLTAKAKTLKRNDKTKKYTATLKTNKNKVMKNTKVTIKVNKKTYTAKTNSKGVATFKLTKLTKKGKYSATVKYAGSKYYNSKTVKVKITVK